MTEAGEFLSTLALVLGVGALTTVAFHRLKQPVVLGYLLAGALVGPRSPLPLEAHEPTVRLLSELGVILLMFSLGLDFTVQKLLRVGTSSGFVAAVETSLMAFLGYTAGQLLGFTGVESLFVGGVVAISSTTIVVKAFAERGLGGRLADRVFGILVFEDLVAVALLAVLTTVASGTGVSASGVLITLARLGGFLGFLVAAGLLVVPRLVRAIVRMDRPETLLVTSIAICFVVSLLAAAVGYSLALGAFLAGALVGESGEEKRIGQLIEPVRDLFGAIFFVSVGMLIDPLLIAEHWGAVLTLVGVVVLGKVVTVSLATFLTGVGSRSSLQTGMSLAQIGEFSFIIAGLGLSTGATRPFLYPVAVAVSASTTLLTPWLIRSSDAVAGAIDRHLPRPVQTFVTLYGSWLEQLRSATEKKGDRARMRRQFRLQAVDAGALLVVVVAASTSMEAIEKLVMLRTGLASELTRVAILLGAAVLAAPFVIGVIRRARFLGSALAARVMPAVAGGKVDLAAAPRRALVVTLQLALVLAVAAPLVALTRPFVPLLGSLTAFGLLLLLLGLGFWKSATNLEGHVRAGAQVVAETLLKQAHSSVTSGPLTAVGSLLPGLGEATSLRLEGRHPAVGKTLAALNLRGLTGATVLALARGGQGLGVPRADEVLQEGDVLALTGSGEAVDTALALLTGGQQAANG